MIPLPGIQSRFFEYGKTWFWIKLVLVQVLWHQGQQTCAGAHGIQRRFFGYGKRRFWIRGQILNDLQSSVLLSAIATSDIWTLTSAHRTSGWRVIGHLLIWNSPFAAWRPLKGPADIGPYITSTKLLTESASASLERNDLTHLVGVQNSSLP